MSNDAGDRTIVLNYRQTGRTTAKAREILAREYDKEGCHGLAENLRAGQFTTHLDECSIRAIAAVLRTATTWNTRHQPNGGAGAEDARDAALVEAYMEGNGLLRSAHAVCERVATQYATVYAGTNFGALHERLNEHLKRYQPVYVKYAAMSDQNKGKV